MVGLDVPTDARKAPEL